MITNFEKPEILSPAGDMDCLKSALNFGADAVFLAGKMFGMRSAPQNFDNDQLKKACDLAHAKGARIHVTCNTLHAIMKFLIFRNLWKMLRLAELMRS